MDSQEELKIEVDVDIVTLVRRLTELTEAIRRSIDEAQHARTLASMMSLNDITHELDMAKLRLAHARYLLEQHSREAR